MEATIQDAMSELLGAMGFERMAQDVRTESDLDTLRKYARLIVNKSPESMRLTLANKFRMLRPPLY